MKSFFFSFPFSDGWQQC